MTHYTHNEFHLGDNLVHLHFLRHLARGEGRHAEFVHAVHRCHIEELRAVVADVPNVQLIPMEDRPGYSIDAWKNAGAGTPGGGYWERHPKRADFTAFHLDWFRHLAATMGYRPPFVRPEHLLFDYPAILASKPRPDEGRIDFLVVNSQPCSGQFLDYQSLDCMDGLIARLVEKYSRVVVTQKCSVPGVECTAERGLSLSGIGGLSCHADHLVMVATGPMWPTFNIWNLDSVKTRLVLISNGEFINLAPGTCHVSSIAEAERVLTEKGLL